MLEILVLGYIIVALALFIGARDTPRLRAVLITLGVLWVVVPILGLLFVAWYLGNHPLRFG